MTLVERLRARYPDDTDCMAAAAEIERLERGLHTVRGNADRWEKLALTYKREIERLEKFIDETPVSEDSCPQCRCVILKELAGDHTTVFTRCAGCESEYVTPAQALRNEKTYTGPRRRGADLLSENWARSREIEYLGRFQGVGARQT